MENNKILIGIQFTNKDENSRYYHYNIELYVLRDLSLFQLMEGIKYGLAKLSSGEDRNRGIYSICREIYSNCIAKIEQENDGKQYLSHITYTSFNNAKAESLVKGGDRTLFYLDDMKKPICELGFITSSRIIFDATGSFVPKGELDITNIIEAFNPSLTNRVSFPEYNISTRQLFKFDDCPIEIIDPTDPPRKNNDSLFFMLLPSIVTIGVLMLVRLVLMNGNIASGMTMLALSAAMGITAAVTTMITWKRQKKEYDEAVKAWRNQYQDYIDGLLEKIQTRQIRDKRKLDELYPDMTKLIQLDDKGVYSLNEHLYSRSSQDSDFLSFRVANSDAVESLFSIKGSDKEVVFSESSFDIVTDNSGNDRLRIFLRNELKGQEGNKKTNLCRLPVVISERYKYLQDAPLVYSLKNKSALGIVDYNMDDSITYSKYFVTRMIFELCYYHSPEELQFVVFFNQKDRWTDIENTMNMYKFMPHFRGLFSDKSQFVFDSNSASLVLSNLLTIMGRRKASLSEGGGRSNLPHIVIIVFEDHGMKEHAFAEYLPTVPENFNTVKNESGVTFIFATKYKEYLPAYCDDIISFDGDNMTITPYENINNKQAFSYASIVGSDTESHFIDFTKKTARAFRFLSSVYYAQIAQNGKVPSAVSAFELLCNEDLELKEIVRANWVTKRRKFNASITETLSVPVGKTETGIAYLDLHEKSDGPHMLVAGTTGSGKTETIITYLLGLCMKYRPDELNLLLVDMKGGGFTKRIGHLPHVVGSVTDVDGYENGTGAEYMLGRFLYAMQSEIKRRKLLFNKMYVDNIDAYIKACKDIESFIEQKKLYGSEADEVRKTAKSDPLSHLVLVVDEFTELKRFSNENSELDFMGEITTIARVGRSLGFHIILISQNIEGAITEDIRVNSRARLCLKVATRQASKDMIGTELAASPYMPGNGRAYLLVGTGSKFEYFQSGYSGAETLEDVPVEIMLASKYGAYSTFYQSDKDNAKLLEKKLQLKKRGESKTQLEAITESICEVYNEMKNTIALPHIVFRAPLPTCIAMSKDGNVIDLNKKKGGQ